MAFPLFSDARAGSLHFSSSTAVDLLIPFLAISSPFPLWRGRISTIFCSVFFEFPMIYFLSVEKVAGLSLGLIEASEVCRRYQRQRLPHISTLYIPFTMPFFSPVLPVKVCKLGLWSTAQR